jgi:DNA helicase-4
MAEQQNYHAASPLNCDSRGVGNASLFQHGHLDICLTTHSNVFMIVRLQIADLMRRLKAGADPSSIQSEYEKLLARSPFLKDHLRSTGDHHILQELDRLPEVIREKEAALREREAQEQKAHTDNANRLLAAARRHLLTHGLRADKLFARDLAAQGTSVGDHTLIRDKYQALKVEVFAPQILESRKRILASASEAVKADYLSADREFRRLTREAGFMAGEISTLEYEYNRIKISHVKQCLTRTTCGEQSVPPPDDEQAAAIAVTRGNVQVTARAGSGKTMTIINRVAFLIQECAIAPSEILLLAFNRKAAVEIRERLLCRVSADAKSLYRDELSAASRQRGARSRPAGSDEKEKAIDAVVRQLGIALPHAMTFHALAYAIVHPEEDVLSDLPDGESLGLSRAFQDIIDEHLRSPTHYEKIKNLMIARFREDWDAIIDGSYNESKEVLLRYRKSLPRESMRGEYVKSFGEKAIADFLFEHDIAYKYECNHWWNGRNYRPDFTIFGDNGTGVAIEYFGLQGDPDYDAMTEAKRLYWSKRVGWKLLEITPRDIAGRSSEAVVALLRGRLEAGGITCVELSDDEKWRRLRNRAIDRFTLAVKSFSGRCRKQSLSLDDLMSRLAVHRPICQAERMFVELAPTLYGAYLERLAATGEDDFDGLVQKATAAILGGQTQYHRRSCDGDIAKLRYVFIDEFQDFSDLFYRLLMAMRERNKSMELFCVGDDWQAINAFAGSDLRFFVKGEEYVGTSQRMEMRTNYRSTKRIVAVGNALMLGRGLQAKASRQEDGRVHLVDLQAFEPNAAEQEQFPGDDLTPAVLRILGAELRAGNDAALLCRRNSIPWYVAYGDTRSDAPRDLGRYLELIRSRLPEDLRPRVTISTVHRYKGLERKCVILVDAVEHSYPLLHPDWVFSRVFGETPSKIIDEERRLLYVAITRAADSLFVITDGQRVSPFLNDVVGHELMSQLTWSDFPPVTPEQGRLIVKVGNAPDTAGAGTYAVKDQLKASGYRWSSTGWPSWSKVMDDHFCTMEALAHEVWVKHAHGIEVRVFSPSEKLLASYYVVKGQFHLSKAMRARYLTSLG